MKKRKTNGDIVETDPIISLAIRDTKMQTDNRLKILSTAPLAPLLDALIYYLNQTLTHRFLQKFTPGELAFASLLTEKYGGFAALPEKEPTKLPFFKMDAYVRKDPEEPMENLPFFQSRNKCPYLEKLLFQKMTSFAYGLAQSYRKDEVVGLYHIYAIMTYMPKTPNTDQDLYLFDIPGSPILTVLDEIYYRLEEVYKTLHLAAEAQKDGDSEPQWFQDLQKCLKIVKSLIRFIESLEDPEKARSAPPSPSDEPEEELEISMEAPVAVEPTPVPAYPSPPGVPIHPSQIFGTPVEVPQAFFEKLVDNLINYWADQGVQGNFAGRFEHLQMNVQLTPHLAAALLDRLVMLGGRPNQPFRKN